MAVAVLVLERIYILVVIIAKLSLILAIILIVL